MYKIMIVYVASHPQTVSKKKQKKQKKKKDKNIKFKKYQILNAKNFISQSIYIFNFNKSFKTIT